MARRTGDDDLELHVTNFGPIVEAKIDLRPLTVFVGPSNTGKSYLATLLYALHRVFSDAYHYSGAHLRGGIFGQGVRSGLQYDYESSRAVVDELSDIAGSMVSHAPAEGASLQAPRIERLVLPHSVADILGRGFEAQAGALLDELRRCFGVPDVAALIRRGQDGCRVTASRRASDQRNPVRQRISIDHRQGTLECEVPADVPIPATVVVQDLVTQSLIDVADHADAWSARPSDRESAFGIDSFVSALGSVVLSSLVAPLHRHAVHLPADRTGIMRAHRVVVSSLIANASSAGLGPVGPAQTMTGVLADFLTHLVNMNPFEDPPKRTLEGLAGEIEAVLGGSVAMHRSPVVNYPHVAYRPEGWETDLALANASSMVSDLAPLVLILRHRIDPGHTLIVEEPESHLHPAKQVELTRQLVKLVHAGVRVVVTTHSEWLLEELANVVKRSLLSEDARERHANADASLRGDQVGVWLFEPTRRSGGSVVREARIDDSGLFPDGFDEVARALHNDWARMGNDIGSRS